MKVKYISHMHSDKTVAEIARISFAKEIEGKSFSSKDASLIEFLASGMSSKEYLEIRDEAISRIYEANSESNHVEILEGFKVDTTKASHFTPFAHPQITLKMQAPIPIRTQCFKSKVGFVENEESRRYIATTPELFIPEFRKKPDGSIKQGSAGLHEFNADWQKAYKKQCGNAIVLYEHLIATGIAPEQARFVLPQGCEVNWVWTGSLIAFARFCNLRKDSHAQGEIQDLAKMVSDIIQPLFPVSWEALTGETHE